MIVNSIVMNLVQNACKFEQRHTDRTGLGLGLSISRRGARALGGDISVTDLPGIGRVFTVGLRRSVAAEAEQPAQDA